MTDRGKDNAPRRDQARPKQEVVRENRRKWAKRIAGGVLAGGLLAGVATGTAQQVAGTAIETLHNALRHHVEPNHASLGDTTLHRGVQMWEGVGPQIDPSMNSNFVDWDRVVVKGIPFRDYKTIKGSNVYTIEVPRMGTNRKDTYIVIPDALVDGQEKDLTIEETDPNVSHSLDKHPSGLYKDANGAYFAIGQGGVTIPESQLGVLTPGEPAK